MGVFGRKPLFLQKVADFRKEADFGWRLGRCGGFVLFQAVDLFDQHEDDEGNDQEVDDLNSQIFRETVSFMIEDPRTINRAMKIGFVSKYLERIADHATNIAEMVIFMVKGKSIRHIKEIPPSI